MHTLSIAVFGGGWWDQAAAKLGAEASLLPIAVPEDGNAYAADVAGRVRVGAEVQRGGRAVDAGFWLDNGGAGLNFVTGPNGENDLHLLHERADKLLVSHFIDPVHVCFQGLPWQVLWLSMASRTWVKAVWDRAHARELELFGVPNVVHLPMAAPDRDYVDAPVSTDDIRRAVSFVGGQNTNYFKAGVQVTGEQLLPGALASAVRADLADVTFFDVYQDLYALGPAIRGDDPPKERCERLQRYFAAKLFYHASLCIRNRDRFAIFLKRQLGDLFHLIGRGWDTAYGLTCAPQLSDDDYFKHFRETAININLVNGNAETGLNMRHFEITAAGGFLLCYAQPELEECFVVGEECDVFRSETELLAKIEYYLENPQRRAEIARAGQRRTLSNHLYSHRLHTLMTAVQAHKEKPGPQLVASREGRREVAGAASP
ncbi:MAG: glycosyltransferase [Phycisphaerales bacterium]|nr:glycosyltransferase [Phycisphaerales bacterium]